MCTFIFICYSLKHGRNLFGGVSSRSVLGLSMKLMSLLRQVSFMIPICMTLYKSTYRFFLLVRTLLQVLWSFMSGQGKVVESFMGKGVISRASLAMSHLMHTIETQLHPPEVGMHALCV